MPVSMVTRGLALALAPLIATVPCAHSHGAVVYPPPRNAIDANDTLPWSGPVPVNPPGVESATGARRSRSSFSYFRPALRALAPFGGTAARRGCCRNRHGWPFRAPCSGVVDADCDPRPPFASHGA